MAGQQQSAKKGKHRRVPKNKIAAYWNYHHPPNMARRGLRVYRHVLRHQDEAAARSALDRFVTQHSTNCPACKLTLQAQVNRLKVR